MGQEHTQPSNAIIEGIRADIPATKLARLAADHAEFHESRATFYDQQGNYERADDHLDEAVFLRHLASHVQPDAVYRLDQQDMARLGFPPRATPEVKAVPESSGD